jgi:hypothetical protein
MSRQADDDTDVVGTTRRRALDRSALGVLLAAIVTSCGYVPGLGPVVDIPRGLHHEMSVADVEQAVQTAVAVDARALGRVIRPFRVASIRLVAPFEPVSTPRPDASPSSMSFSTNTTTWVVEAEGTFRDCASTCSTYSDAVLVIEDGRGTIVGRHANGPMTLDRTPIPPT